MEIGSKKFNKFWLAYRKEHYKFIYTRTGFGYVKKTDEDKEKEMQCIHGLGPAHIIVDILMAIPFIGTAIAFLIMKKKELPFLYEWLSKDGGTMPRRYMGKALNDYPRHRVLMVTMPFHWLVIWWEALVLKFRFPETYADKIKKDAYDLGYERGRNDEIKRRFQ